MENSVCEECKLNPWKYKCPGCSIRSCGLACVKAHKKRTGCTGKRKLTDFVPLSKFDDNLLLSGIIELGLYVNLFFVSSCFEKQDFLKFSPLKCLYLILPSSVGMFPWIMLC